MPGAPTSLDDFGGVDRFLWIGYYDPSEDQNGGGHASNFAWVDGEQVTYTNWSAYEPDDLNDGEYWVEMYPANVARGPGTPAVLPGTWNDVPNDSYPYEGNSSGNNFGSIYGVVEVVPEPMGLAIAVATTLLAVGRRSSGEVSCPKGVVNHAL